MIFAKKSAYKEKERNRIKEEAQKLHDEVVADAQTCLGLEEFQKYRNEYLKLERTLIEQLIVIDETETDPVKYGFMVKDIVSKYRAVGSLLRGVNRNAGKDQI